MGTEARSIGRQGLQLKLYLCPLHRIFKNPCHLGGFFFSKLTNHFGTPQKTLLKKKIINC